MIILPIVLSIIFFLLLCYLAYLIIEEKQMEKEVLELEMEQGRKKSAKKLREELKDYHLKKSRR